MPTPPSTLLALGAMPLAARVSLRRGPRAHLHHVLAAPAPLTARATRAGLAGATAPTLLPENDHAAEKATT